MKSRSTNPSQSALLKQEFLKKWIKGLYIYTKHSPSRRNMTVSERKRAIKLSADVAIASTRNPTTLWSRSLISKIPAENNDAMKIVVQKISGTEGSHKTMEKDSHKTINYKPLATCTKKILRRSRFSRRVVRSCATSVVKASSIAKRLVKNKTRVLKSLVPGGEEIKDCFTLIKETLDYILSLRVQVDVMRRLANAAEKFDTTRGI